LAIELLWLPRRNIQTDSRFSEEGRKRCERREGTIAMPRAIM
jgi:hypothetical protein